MPPAWTSRRSRPPPRVSGPTSVTPPGSAPPARGLRQTRKLAEENVSWPMLPEHRGGPSDNGANVAACQELVVADPSLQIKAGVQWGLFTAAIVQLGDQEQQARWVPDAMSL